jgi:hypothetical protein
MQTMDADLARLVRAGKVSRALAEQRSSVPEELKRVLGGEAAAMPAPASGYNDPPGPPHTPSYVNGG